MIEFKGALRLLVSMQPSIREPLYIKKSGVPPPCVSFFGSWIITIEALRLSVLKVFYKRDR